MLKRATCLLILVLVLVACDSGSQPTATSQPQPPTPAADTPTVAAAVPTAAPSATAAEPATVPPTAALPASATVPVAIVTGVSDGPRTPTAGAEQVAVDGQPALDLSLAPNGAIYASTTAGFYLLNGNDSEPTASWDWQQLSNERNLQNLIALDADVIVAGNLPPCASDQLAIPLRRSADGGRTWTAAEIYAKPVNTISDDLFAVSCDGIYRSTDTGETWQLQPDLKIVNSDVRDLVVTADGKTAYIVATTEGGNTSLSRSLANVDRWNAPTLLTDTWGQAFVRLGPPEESVYFGSLLGISVSADGETYQPINAGLDAVRLTTDPRSGAVSPADQPKLTNGGINDLTPYEQGLLLATANGLYRSDPENPGWQPLALSGTYISRIIGISTAGIYVLTGDGVQLVRLANLSCA